ncbi:MAG: hypothetical protein GY788_20155 [bacterium]|nr:hypothetical protein [bacterium]
MAELFAGKWKLRVSIKNAGFSQRFVVNGAVLGNGAHAGVVGNEVVVDGDSWTVQLQWNNDAGSGWQNSLVSRGIGSKSPLVIVHVLSADDNAAANRDGDFDDLVVICEDLNPAFDVVQRPFAIDRGTLMMAPDGIFDVSQGVQYMGVKIRNDWHFDWEPWMGFSIGIAPSSKTALGSQGIVVVDSWGSQEQAAFQQEVKNGFIRVPTLRVGDDTTIYFKVDASAAGPGKPEPAFVAQRIAWDNAYDAPDRQVLRQIFVSRSTYDPASGELVAEVPEGRVHMRLKRVLVDRHNAEKSVAAARLKPCTRKPPHPGGGGSLDEDVRDRLRRFMEDLLAGGDVDPCLLSDLLKRYCECAGLEPGGDNPGSDWEGPWGGPDSGGLGEGPGGDDWCRFQPFFWLPIEFDYRVIPNPAYAGQFGPLAFEDPWWKVVLIILAVLLAIASAIVDAVTAGSDPKFIIGQIAQLSNRATSNVDAAVATLDGSRGVDLNVLDAQGDDRNNGLPVLSLDGTIAIDRSDNGDSGIEDPMTGDLVFKSGARSATTRGAVLSVNATAPVTQDDGTVITYTNQVTVTQLAAPEDQPLSQAGDSGSIWVKLSSFRPVALNFAGPTDDEGGQATANPIRDVVNLFNVHFNS